MNKAFEKIIGGIESLKSNKGFGGTIQTMYADGILDKAKQIVQEVAEEYKVDWIACSDRLPDDAFGCLVTVIDCEPSTQTDFENILPYIVGYDGYSWNDVDGNVIPFEVIAWQPLPEPFKECD